MLFNVLLLRSFKKLQTLKSTLCSIGMQNYHFAPMQAQCDTVICFLQFPACTKYVWNFFSFLWLEEQLFLLWVFYTTFPGNYLHGLYHYCFVIGYSDSVCWCYKSMLQIMGTLRLPLHSTKSLPSIPMLNNFAHRCSKIEQGGSVNCNFLSK